MLMVVMNNQRESARLAMTVVTSIGTVVLPRVANLFQKSNLDEAKRYVYQAFRVVWLLAIPIMFGLMGVSSVFIPLFLGSGFDDAIGLLCIFSILVLVVSLAYVTGISYLIPTKQQNVYTAAVTIAAIVNFCMNLILIPRVGVFGAAIASIVAETIGTAIQIIYCISKKQLNAKQIFCALLEVSLIWKYHAIVCRDIENEVLRRYCFIMCSDLYRRIELCWCFINIKR